MRMIMTMLLMTSAFLGGTASEAAGYRLLVPRHKKLAKAAPVVASTPVSTPETHPLALAYQELSMPLACTRLALGWQSSELLVAGDNDLSGARKAASAVVMHLRFAQEKAFVAAADIPGARADVVRRGRIIDATALIGLALNRDVAGLVTDVNDLRQLPFMLEGSQVVILVPRMEGLNAERLEMVAAVAKQRRITLSLIWTGERPMGEAARGLALLAQMTGGLAWDLSQVGKGACE